jgi:hypothetical protein
MKYSLRYTTTQSASANDDATKQLLSPRDNRRQMFTGTQAATNVVNCVNRKLTSVEDYVTEVA